MASPEHLRILKQGVEAWNRWRAQNPGTKPNLARSEISGLELAGVDLHDAELCAARIWFNDMSGADLRNAHLMEAQIIGCELDGADMSGAYAPNLNLTESKLNQAKFYRAHFEYVNLSLTELWGADFRGLTMHSTIFAENDLSSVIGLEAVTHNGPSTLGIDTIYMSKGNIPEIFLRGCGVPEGFIVYMRSLVGKAIDYYSCFISYSSKDDDFAQRLYADLQAKNVRCWKFNENAKWGEPVWGEIDTAIRHYDKLVVICSEHSLQSQPVIREIERALQKEERERKNVLFPIRIDDYLLDVWEHPRKADVVSKVVGDFRGWRDLVAYSQVFPRFLDALNRPPQPTVR